MVNEVKKFTDIHSKESLEIFKGIFEYSPNGIVVADSYLNIILFNNTAEKLTEKKNEAVIGSRVQEVFPKLNLYETDKKTKDSYMITINGKKLLIKHFAINVKNGISAIILIIQDLSEVFKLTMELEKSQHVVEELEDILEGSFDGVLVTDGDGKVLMVNKSYERITDIKKEELLGKNMKELINPVWMKNSVALLVAEEKKPISLHHTTRHGKSIIVTGTPVYGKKGEMNKIVINARDISEIYELREELQKAREMEKLYFKNLSDTHYKKGDKSSIVVVSEVMQEIFVLANKVSNFDATVLITGESGVGKEEVAKYIHNNSLRKNNPFVAINCGSIPEQLLESELFGYEKGAFTGASKEGKTGLFEAAQRGTLFLDEIGEMSLNLQVKLLRVLEGREINRIGSVKPVKLDVRIIAATNKNLEQKVEVKEFREDLFYRLNVIQIKIPSLRERTEDIAPMALHFLQQFNLQYGLSKKLTYDVIKELEAREWTGNIRQLKNMIENMVIVSNNEYLQVNDLPWNRNKKDKKRNDKKEMHSVGIIPLQQAVEQVEREILEKAKEKYKSSRRIAKAIQVDQSTVVRKLKKYGITSNNE